ncbi:MAG: Twitching motility protein [Parcubacteria group bacterium GW2011_GWD2_43_10]|uniref:Type IV pili twitching motility protein PilT n=4 Tax=Candidatus Vebleniibacteriota TaxID=1817921 RepID=A0A1G2Q7C8_9BACT|nr:MAG: Twitching motility protein [Parcubacteria group bacterium GW2011_GWD1_42_9]KKS81272.1 MAG: Twitching motility protein [Parcubacteria group bacterium GW2011_GWD2_43_10]KKS92011.1 MAG: Twitching motility protein [Parcubacteria group bacterium GW2011_GWE2_43_12]OHA54720.1 MAG: type IV pili twitching motility protein PilT [Candidatus Veblenbacteria bacterium RIFOXYB1_FULL_43_13]OHA55476.1 MAG: type IV pili twitching motility protein PilT [Candidatus Veblenbacteria bacterium RIFOXYA2_FULL_43
MTIETLFSQASERGASDLHLAVGLPPTIRLHGELKPLEEAVLTPKKMEELIFSILQTTQQDRFQKERELDVSYELKDGTRFRVNLHYEKDNMGLVARVIPTTIPNLEDIGMPEVVYNLTRMDYGLVLVTGPTGCGKSTTLAAMIKLINSERSLNIITLEDPIEFLFRPDKSIIKQRQLGTDMISFGEGLKHTLRQDPNVIMVGEMRDLDTIGTTLTLAETGHLVLATLHTSNAAQTIDRIIDVFPPHQQTQVRLQLSFSLKAVISQRLLPKEGGGRVAAREILLNNPAISNLIRENKVAQIKSVIQTGAEDGMVTMDQHIKRLVQDKIISRETALAHISSPDVLK